MEIRQLKTFVSIVKLGSFSQAAQMLGYTQSTVTTHIQLLEKGLNTILFDRFGQQLILTADGERLYDYAEKITRLTEDAKNALHNSDIPQGRVVIGMSESLCVYRLPAMLQEYSTLYPNVELIFKFGICSDFKNLVRKNTMDLAFILEKNVKDADLVNTLLCAESIVMVASPNHALVELEGVKAEDLENQTLILVESGSGYRNVLEKSLEKARVCPKTMLEVCQIQTIKQLVINNLGITVLPLVVVQNELEAGSLVILPWQGPEFHTNTFLVYHKEKWLSHAMRSFIKLVQERLTQSL